MTIPATLDRPTGSIPLSPSQEALTFLEHLWNGLDGWACLAVGSGQWNDQHRYKIPRWQDHYFRSTELDAFVDRAVAEATANDVFFCPALRSSKSRGGGTAAPSRYVWADVDGTWGEAEATTWEALASAFDGSMLIHSGRGRHLYVGVAEPICGDELTLANRHLSNAFEGGDAKWPDNALLRVPGTLNHKGRILDDGEPYPVLWQHA